MGIDSFSAVINPPQSCILAIGKTDKRPLWDPKATEGAHIKWADMMNITLSCDHRVVDGAVGAKWIKAFKQYLENPVLLLI